MSVMGMRAAVIDRVLQIPHGIIRSSRYSDVTMSSTAFQITRLETLSHTWRRHATANPSILPPLCKGIHQ